MRPLAGPTDLPATLRSHLTGARARTATRVIALCAGLTVGLGGASCGSKDARRTVSGDDPDSGPDAAGTGGRGAGGSKGTGGSTTGGAGGAPEAGGAGGTPEAGGAGGTPEAGAGGDASIGGDAATSIDAASDALAPLTCAAGFGDCDGERSNGCETSLSGDPEHCGSCDRNCAGIGGTCSQSTCSAVPLFSGLPFGSDGSGARSWEFSDGAAYHLGVGPPYAVSRYPVNDSDESVVWQSSPSSIAGAESVAMLGDNVIWAQRGTPPVVLSKSPTAPAATLPAVLFTPEYTPTFLTVQGANLYWASGDYQSGDPGGYIYSRPANAASSVPGTRIVTANQGTHGAIVAFTATTDALYWVTSQGTVPFELRTAPIAGGDPTAVPGGAVTGGFSTLQATLWTSGNVLYFNRNVETSFLNGIYRYQPGDPAPVQLVAAEDVMTFVFDDTSFYYVIQNQTGVYKAPIGGGAGVLISNGYGSEIVGQDATSLYLIQPGCCASVLSRVLK